MVRYKVIKNPSNVQYIYTVPKLPEVGMQSMVGRYTSHRKEEEPVMGGYTSYRKGVEPVMGEYMSHRKGVEPVISHSHREEADPAMAPH